MKHGGFIPLWRKIEESWQWEHPLRRSAWVWMLVKAAYESHNGLSRGQLYFTLSQAKPCWGMTKKQARIFIKRCVEMGDIIWEPGRSGVKGCAQGTSEGTSRDTYRGTCRGKITLLNYETYNSLQEVKGTSEGTSRDGSLAPIENKKKTNKKKSTPLPPKEVEVIKSELEKVDLPKLRQNFPQKDVNATWEEFYECCISGTAKKPKPNPYDYVDFEKGFLTWLRKRPDIANTKDTSWDTEY